MSDPWISGPCEKPDLNELFYISYFSRSGFARYPTGPMWKAGLKLDLFYISYSRPGFAIYLDGYRSQKGRISDWEEIRSIPNITLIIFRARVVYVCSCGLYFKCIGFKIELIWIQIGLPISENTYFNISTWELQTSTTIDH